MSELEWKESWSVGYNLLDEDHMVLIDIINRVKATQENNKPIDWVLQDLSDYVDLHFSREEEMMHIVGYSGFDEHVKEHRSFVEWLNTVKFSFNNWNTMWLLHFLKTTGFYGIISINMHEDLVKMYQGR